MRGPSSMIRSSGTFHTPMPLAEKPARRWKRIAATRRSALALAHRLEVLEQLAHAACRARPPAGA